VRDEAECPYLVLRYGIAHHGWIVEWCRQTERELALRAAQPAAEA
jgi:hypothetical protein